MPCRSFAEPKQWQDDAVFTTSWEITGEEIWGSESNCVPNRSVRRKTGTEPISFHGHESDIPNCVVLDILYCLGLFFYAIRIHKISLSWCFFDIFWFSFHSSHCHVHVRSGFRSLDGIWTSTTAKTRTTPNLFRPSWNISASTKNDNMFARTILVGGFKHDFLFSIIYGMSSFLFTFIFFKMVKTTNQHFLRSN